MSESVNEHTILVTGFGPFGIHTINSSWESVKLLPPSIEGFNIVKEEIPVCYETVDKKIKELWQRHQPKLVIHVGVSKYADKITLESKAYRGGYLQKDVFGKSPDAQTCPSQCEKDEIHTCLHLDDIKNHVNGTLNVKACISEDVGRYLCGYTYYTSLDIDRERSLFIHVPPLNEPYTAEDLALGISEVIKQALKQL